MNTIAATLFHVPMATISLLLTLNDLNLYKITNVTSISPSVLMTAIFFIAFIYFIVDTYFMYKNYIPRHNIYFFHHGIALISLPISYFLKWNYARYVMYYMTFELSTPIYNFTYELHKRGYTADYWIFWFNQWLFAIIFTLIRVIFGTYTSFILIKEIIQDQSVSNYYIVFPLSLQSLMYYWFYSIANKLL
jgi:hypothetical protein